MFERPPAARDSEIPGVLVLLPWEGIPRNRRADGLPGQPGVCPGWRGTCAVGASLVLVGGPLGRTDGEQWEMAPGMQAEWA